MWWWNHLLNNKNKVFYFPLINKNFGVQRFRTYTNNYYLCTRLKINEHSPQPPWISPNAYSNLTYQILPAYSWLTLQNCILTGPKISTKYKTQNAVRAMSWNHLPTIFCFPPSKKLERAKVQNLHKQVILMPASKKSTITSSALMNLPTAHTKTQISDAPPAYSVFS